MAAAIREAEMIAGPVPQDRSDVAESFTADRNFLAPKIGFVEIE